MTRDEHLYSIAAEEAVEVAQRATKILRFGPDEIQPGQPHDNRFRLLQEYADLTGVMRMLGFHVGPQPGTALDVLVNQKIAKVEKFIAYSAECGTLGSAQAGKGE